MRRLLPLGLVLCGALPARAANVYVPLTVEEPAGVARRAAPVTSGVPLPRGRVRATRDLRIVDAASGAPLPASFQTLATWPDGSLKWVLVDFATDLAAGGSLRLALTEDPFTPAPPAPTLSIVQGAMDLTIDTGAAQFRIAKAGFRGLDAVTVAGQPLLAAPGGNFLLARGPATFSTAADATSSVSIEEQGAMRAVLFAFGSFDDGAGGKLLEYEARLHFYAGQSFVRAFFTLKNREAALHPGNVWDLGSAGSRLFDDLSFDLPLGLAAPLSWTLWGEPAPPLSGTLNTSVTLYQESSGGARWDWATHVNRNNVVPMTLRGHVIDVDGAPAGAGNRARGVLDVSSATAGVAVGLRHFWENFPKALRARGGAGLSLGLFPAEFPDSHELQGGEHKTHEILLYFHAGDAAAARVDEVLAGLAAPLRARPEWDEALRTQAFSLFGPRDTAAFPDYENTIEYMAFDKGVRSFFTQREEIDEYGWRNFGEAMADHETDCGVQCWDCPISHDNNQYDYDWAALLGWIRDGRRPWLDLGEQGVRHLYDIDVYHTELDTPAYNRGMFWHTTHDTDAFTSTHRTYSRLMSAACTPYLSGGPALEHLYVEGLLDYFYLTGDRRAWDTFGELFSYLLARYALDAPAPGAGYPTRGFANALRAAVAQYRRGWQPVAYTQARRVVIDSEAAGNPGVDGTSFGDSMLMTSLGRFLDMKEERGEGQDGDAAVARASLLEYARRVRSSYAPRQDVLDFRYSEALWSAYKHAPAGDPDKASFAQLGRDFFAAGSRTAFFNTYITNKGLAHTATNGQLHTYFERGRIPQPVGRLLAVRAGGDVVLSWTAVADDLHGNPLAAVSYAVHRSLAVPTRYTDRRLGVSPTPTWRAAGDVGGPGALHFYEARAVAEPGVEGY